MIEQITVNPINESLFSADFIKGFRCGAKRQFQADVEEIAKAKFGRPTGKWIIHDEVKNIYGGIYIECSECGTKFVTQTLEDEHFCRNCGVKMVREDGDTE